jgi:hypothetical protein
VQTVDVYGNRGPLSATRSIVVTGSSAPLPAPTLRFPTNDARLRAGQAVTFDWSDVAGVVGCTLQVDDSSTFGSTARARADGDHPVAVRHRDLPTRRLWWRVRAVGSDGVPGALSASRRLEIRN